MRKFFYCLFIMVFTMLVYWNGHLNGRRYVMTQYEEQIDDIITKSDETDVMIMETRERCSQLLEEVHARPRISCPDCITSEEIEDFFITTDHVYTPVDCNPETGDCV